ncbi:MAG TPA: chemotaxis protein CheB [Polyangiales bacterium]|nr:chemotaxis protein CheB [Polyangiales bacterium]
MRVLAVADASVLAGLRRALPAESIELAASASTPVRALSELRRVYPDVVVLDLALTQTDVFQLLPQLAHERNTAVLALTSGPEATRQAERAWDAGASDVMERPGATAQDDSASLHALSLRVLALAAAQRPRTSRPSLPSVSRAPKPPASVLLSKPASPLSAAARPSTLLPLSAAPRTSLPLPASPRTDLPQPAAPRLRTPQSLSAPRADLPLPASPRTDLPQPAAPRPRTSQPLPAAPRTGLPLSAVPRPKSAACLLAIGASTGGTLALTELLRELPANAPPVLVVQHMLPEFTYDFAERLNDACVLQVRQASDGAMLEAGHVLIAPGGKHMRLARNALAALYVRVSDDAPVNKHRPSVDVLFKSCAEVLGAASVGVLLTGMGDDGARGLLALRNAGARTIVQDQASSACFGMPSAAIGLGAVEQVLSLRGISHALIELATQSECCGPR